MLSQEEEEILKLIAAETKASFKVNSEREKQVTVITPFLEAAKIANQALKDACK